jgi:hypothetical protein
LILLLLLPAAGLLAQGDGQMDSINFNKLHFTHNKFVNNIFQQAISSVRRNGGDDIYNVYLNGKSEAPFEPYQGKIIRHITVRPYGFDRSFKDTSQRDNSKAARIGDRLHLTTRKWVVKEDLFIKEHTPLNAFKVADNERYLRSLDYIQDARILVDTIAGAPDSVDITVYTKDLFSIAISGASNGLNHINLDLYDANVLGMAQKLEITGLYDYTRTPNFAYGGMYRKHNVLHSFIDATFGVSTMIVSDFTHREESTEYMSLTKRLISPYSRFAGGLVISHNQSFNPYNVPYSISYLYNFYYIDAWVGYNIGIKALTATNNTIRDRRFLAFRYFNRDYTKLPQQPGPGQFDPIYNSSYAILSQFTFFRQDYFRTQYIYGFGTTEDLPYGYNLSATFGWHHQLTLDRPYAGITAFEYVATKYGDFLQFYLRAGSFFHKNDIEDASYLIGTTMFSRIFFWNSTKIRQYANINYTTLYNRVTYGPLRINSDFGLRGFLSDSVTGARRLSLQLETEFFLKHKLFGFQFAPFPWGDLSFIGQERKNFLDGSLYAVVGAGIRARNENLIFETIELRAYFFPVAPTNMRGFKLILNSNIRYRYSSNYINAPDFVQLN